MEGWGCHPTIQTLSQNCYCLEELQGQIEKNLRERRSSDRPRLGFNWGEGWIQSLTLLLVLWFVCRGEPGMLPSKRSSGQLKESDEDTCTHLTNRGWGSLWFNWGGAGGR